MKKSTVSESSAALQESAKIVRGLSMDAVQKANSGHPGLPMGMADTTVVLWKNFLNHNPTNPKWFNRDRFVLSGGHGSMLLYSMLHLTGYDLSLEDLKQFRQWGSKTPGHPEYHDTPGVETTTGPLGQGVANAVGMALAEKSLSARYNKEDHKIVDHYTYVMCGDGDLQEGIVHEASALAATWKLGKLVMLYDDNNITIDGETKISFTEDVLKRYEAYGWHVQAVDGHNMKEVETAVEAARAVTDKPSIVACKTIIGFGSPNKQGTSGVHGSPLGAEEMKLTKEKLGLPVDKTFFVSEEAASFMKSEVENGKVAEEAWNEQMKAYSTAFPELATEFTNIINNKLPEAWEEKIPTFDTDMATRQASGAVLNAIVNEIPSIVGGSADLSPSNNTFAKGLTSFSAEQPEGRYIHYGVREHGMTSIMNGLALHGGVIPYSGTFFVFSDYMRPAVRMAALMQQQAIYVLTHDSIGLGEDGPTHQPVEHLAALRVMPNVTVFRPADANETAIGWKVALENTTGPTALVLTRQKLKTVDRSVAAPVSDAEKGAYVLVEDEKPAISLFASGSEVEIIMNAKEQLNAKGIGVRVISVPSFELFDKQDEEYIEKVIEGDEYLPKVAIEAASTFSWHKYLAGNAIIIGIDDFGASAPYETLYEKFGITVENVILATEQLLDL